MYSKITFDLWKQLISVYRDSIDTFSFSHEVIKKLSASKQTKIPTFFNNISYTVKVTN